MPSIVMNPVSANYIHLCVDTQRMFQEATEWHIAGFSQSLPQIIALTAACPARTIFTRFIPAQSKGEGKGTWRNYYERWEKMTIDVIGKQSVEIVNELNRFIPPAKVIDKHVYSPWVENNLHALLMKDRIDTLIVSGGETDVCVLSTVMDAIDYGFRVILANDAVCGSCQETHSKVLALFEKRFGSQIESAATEEILYLLPKG